MSALGLALDIVGVWLLAYSALLPGRAVAMMGTCEDLEGEGRRRAAIQLQEEGRLGVVLAIAGFTLQFIGTLQA